MQSPPADGSDWAQQNFKDSCRQQSFNSRQSQPHFSIQWSRMLTSHLFAVLFFFYWKLT